MTAVALQRLAEIAWSLFDQIALSSWVMTIALQKELLAMGLDNDLNARWARRFVGLLNLSYK